MAVKNDQTGGYDIEFVKALDERYKCPACTFVLRSPFQTVCGHRFCETCIKPIIESGPKTCPVDDSPLTLEEIFRDAFCNREILDLECYCNYKPLGCKWTGLLRKIEAHHDSECLFVVLECLNDGCDVKTQRRLLENHMKKDCRFQKTPCPYCSIAIPEKFLEKHQDEECPKIKLPCPSQCGLTVAREDMERHIGQDCANAESTCPFEFGACAFQGSRGTLKKHLQEKSVYHAYKVQDQVSMFKSQIEDILTKQALMTVQFQQLERKVSNQNELFVPLRDDLETLRGMSESQEKKIQDVVLAARTLSPVDKKEEGATKPDTSNEVNDMKKSVKKLEDQVSKLHTRERQALQTSAQAPTVVGGTGEETMALGRRVTRMEHQHTLSDVQMAEFDVKISVLEMTSYDGAFIWKIEELGRRIHEAVTGKALSIYSTPFFVGRFGYKVCARVYLNGDGMGKGTHLSLFFVVMRGMYDALLPWPFQQKVSFKLVDQSGDQHIVDSFRPDPNSSSFQRPTGNMNIASGCPLFVPKSVLHSRGYIKDESLFFKITVDQTGIPNF